MDANRQYWLSHSYTNNDSGGWETAAENQANHRTQITIVLDGEARYSFSAIRLLWLCKETGYLNDLVIRECPSTFTFGATSRRTYRSVKLNRKQQHSSTQICTIAFEVSEYRGDLSYEVTATTLQPSDGSTPLRVAYDRVYPIEIGSPSLFVLLYFTRPDSLLEGRLPEFSMHNVRILPIKRSYTSLVLPHNVIRYVVYLATLQDDEWYHRLLSYALVCKAWEQVLELRFERVHKVLQRKLNPFRVLDSLRFKPQYGAFIRELSYHNCANRVDNLFQLPDFIEILKYAKLTVRLSMPLLPHHLVNGAMELLCDLRKIRECDLGTTAPTSERMNMADIQYMLLSWDDLYDLKVRGWGVEPRVYGLKYVLPQHIDSRMKNLNLREGHLTRQQLLYFASSTNCNLTSIVFTTVDGPSNIDFLDFLSAAASTLQRLDVQDCDFPRSSIGEELAVDAVMPQMESLQVLSTTVYIATSLSLIRKPPLSQWDQIRISWAKSDTEAEAFVDSLRTTEWKSVTFYRFPDRLVVAEMEEIAQFRGIHLKIS